MVAKTNITSMLTDLGKISHERGPSFTMVSCALKHHHRGRTKLFFCQSEGFPVQSVNEGLDGRTVGKFESWQNVGQM